MRRRRLAVVSPVAGAVATWRVKKEAVETADWDATDVVTVRYLAEVKGVAEAVKALGQVQRAPIERFAECYGVFVRLQASKEECQQLCEKAKEFFPFFEEYLVCVGY